MTLQIIVFTKFLNIGHFQKSARTDYKKIRGIIGNEFVELMFSSLRFGNTAPFEKMLLRWRAVGNTVSDLSGPRFEP